MSFVLGFLLLLALFSFVATVYYWNKQRDISYISLTVGVFIVIMLNIDASDSDIKEIAPLCSQKAKDTFKKYIADDGRFSNFEFLIIESMTSDCRRESLLFKIKTYEIEDANSTTGEKP